MTIEEKLSALAESKNAIKTAIESKGVPVGQAAFSEYADKIQAIPVTTEENTYTRPADWLPIPEIGEDEEVLYLLTMVSGSGTSTYLKIVTGDGGNYTVDYGDGVEPQIRSSGAQSSKTVETAKLPDSSLTSLGYKQALIKVTATGGIREAYVLSAGRTYSSTYLQVVGNLPNCVKFCTYTDSSSSVAYLHSYMEIFDLRKHNLTSVKDICRSMKSLRIANLGDTSKVTDFSGAFNECTALTHLPNIDVSMATTLNSFCQQCNSLRYVSAMDTRRVTDWTNAFLNCTCLVKLPPLNFVSATTLSNVVGACYSLREFTFHNTPLGISLPDTKPEKSVLIDNVFNNLANVSGQTLTLPKTVPLANFTAEEKAIATSKGWVLA